jgi:hypothetical protein
MTQNATPTAQTALHPPASQAAADEAEPTAPPMKYVVIYADVIRLRASGWSL